MAHASPADPAAISAAFVRFLGREFGLQPEELEDDAALFTSGVLSSLDIVRLVLFMEAEFGITVSPLDVSLERFDSVDRLTEYVLGRRQAA
jgi:acyl carrier protein